MQYGGLAALGIVLIQLIFRFNKIDKSFKLVYIAMIPLSVAILFENKQFIALFGVMVCLTIFMLIDKLLNGNKKTINKVHKNNGGK